jgi:hypothetical protein
VVRHAINFKVAEGIVKTLHVIEPFGDIHVGEAAVSHNLAFYCEGSEGIVRLVHGAKVIPSVFGVGRVFNQV